PRPLRTLVAVLAGLVPLACVRPLRMCTAGADCGPLSSCVAGRCVARGAVPAIATARRMLYAPIDLGYVRRADRAAAVRDKGGAGVPGVVILGRDDGRAFLRFSVPLAPEVGIVEAYVLLDRVVAIDADPVTVTLHLARVADAWDGASLSWAVQPRVEEVGSPVTRVLPSAGPVVRLDARLLVEQWRRRRGATASDAFGVAVLANRDATPSVEESNPSGMAFALAPDEPLESVQSLQDGRCDHPDSARAGECESPRDRVALAPRLELYLR
ncbi:MAG TPA: hypothetical protein VII82_01980, partial [Polyangiaceae bacterium]